VRLKPLLTLIPIGRDAVGCWDSEELQSFAGVAFATPVQRELLHFHLLFWKQDSFIRALISCSWLPLFRLPLSFKSFSHSNLLFSTCLSVSSAQHTSLSILPTFQTSLSTQQAHPSRLIDRPIGHNEAPRAHPYRPHHNLPTPILHHNRGPR
jgi:hypothetical protein